MWCSPPSQNLRERPVNFQILRFKASLYFCLRVPCLCWRSLPSLSLTPQWCARCPAQTLLQQGKLNSFSVRGISWWLLQLYLIRWQTLALLRHCLIFRPGSESLTDRFALMDYEARRLLSAIVKNVVQMTAEELEQTNDDNRYDLSILSQLLLYFLTGGFSVERVFLLNIPLLLSFCKRQSK